MQLDVKKRESLSKLYSLNFNFNIRSLFFYVLGPFEKEINSKNEINSKRGFLNFFPDFADFISKNFSLFNFDFISNTFLGKLNVVNLLNPLFLFSSNGKLLIVLDFFTSRDRIIITYYIFSNSYVNHDDLQNTLNVEVIKVFNEYWEKNLIKYKLFNYLDKNSEFFSLLDDFKDEKNGKNNFYLFNRKHFYLQEILKEYFVDNENLVLDKFFLNSYILNLCYNMLKKDFSSISIEDISHLEFLEKNNFIKSFILFKCSANNSPLFQLNRLSNINELLNTFVCPFCGKKLKDEKYEINLVTTKFFEIYFLNFIWLKNIFFGFLLSNYKELKIYEYDKDIYLLVYYNFYILFAFTDEDNYLNYVSYYKDLEVLNFHHLFIFVISKNSNVKKLHIQDDRFFSLINIDTQKLNEDSFYALLSDVKNKIDRILNIFQLSNIFVNFDYDCLINKFKNVTEDISEFIEQKEAIIEEKESIESPEAENSITEKEVKEEIKDEVKEEVKELEIEVFEDERDSFAEEIYEQKEELLESLWVNVLDTGKNDFIEELREISSEVMDVNNEAMDIKGEVMDIKEEVMDIKEEVMDIKEEVISIDESADKNVGNFQELESDNKDIDSIDQLDEINSLLSSEIAETLEVESIIQPSVSQQDLLLLEDKKLSESVSKGRSLYNLDDLLQKVEVNFKNEYDQDVSFKDLSLIFYQLLVLIKKEEKQWVQVFSSIVQKSILFFNTKSLKNLVYNVLLFASSGYKMEPRNEIFAGKYYDTILAKIFIDKKNILSQNEFYLFWVDKDNLVFNFIFDANQVMIVSSFSTKSNIDNGLLSTFPSDIKLFKMDLIYNVVKSLDNLKMEQKIGDFYIFNDNFETIYNSLDSKVLYKINNLYSIIKTIDPFVFGYGFKNEGFYVVFKVNRVFVIVNLKEISFNDIIRIYNKLYLLEII